jgi:hypothetical protein
MSDELDQKIPTKSTLFTSGDVDPTKPRPPVKNPEGRLFIMGDDPRLQKMPEKPTLMDFLKHRFGPLNHVMQSARLAKINGFDEKIQMACFLHDISNAGFIRADHGYWGSALIEPYVSEEISWAIRAHQALRFFPDPEVGYEYPEMYRKNFGDDYTPEPYIHEAYKKARAHKWYMTSRLITLNDLYAFDPSVTVQLEDFTDLIGRNWKDPEQGLGFDNSSSAYMWRTIMWPTRFL